MFESPCVSSLQLYFDRTCVEIGLYCLNQLYDWPVELTKTGRKRRRRRGSRKVPDTRKQRRRLPQERLSKWKRGWRLRYHLWITQWRSQSRLSKRTSVHGLDLKFETTCFGFACNISFYFLFYFLFDLFCITHSLLWY